MGGVSLLKPLWEEVRAGAILGGSSERRGCARAPPLAPSPGWAPPPGFRAWAGLGRRGPPPAAGGAWGEGKGPAPPAHLLTVKCGHLPSRSSAST